MKIMIDGLDYTQAFDNIRPIKIVRKINEPAVCVLWLCLPVSGALAVPIRNQMVSIAGLSNEEYFTGYIAASPMPEYAGLATEGLQYRYVIQAISDEVILDQVLIPSRNGISGGTVSSLLTQLVTGTGLTGITSGQLLTGASVSNLETEPGSSWSKVAGLVSTMARSVYRVIGGILNTSSIPSIIHPLSELDGSLELAALSFTSSTDRALANDITVCGAEEPTAYVTEYYEGDGSTTEFYLTDTAYNLPESKSVYIQELFNESQIDERVWSNVGAPGAIALGTGGLEMNGGTGGDGQTVLAWMTQVDLGGTLLMEAVGVNLSNGSTGTLGGFFVATDLQSECVAGFRVTAQTGSGTVTLQPLIMGSPIGSTYALNASNQYTLRIRIHCPETERELSIYNSCDDQGVVTYGGGWNVAPGYIQMEVQQYGAGVGGTPVTLYDGALASLPGTCSVVPVSAINMVGSMRSFHLTSLGSGWVVSTPPGGTSYTRTLGMTAEAAQCHLSRTGKLVFYSGFAPVVGEQVAVSYRTVGRAVGRSVNTANQAALAAAGLPSAIAWTGSVVNPPARSSQDCRNAALAIQQAASSTSALWSGTYSATNFNFTTDVWPGDALQLTMPSINVNVQVVIRSVELTYRASCPDVVEYMIGFANDWAEDLAIKTSTTVPVDVLLPAPISPTYLQNLNDLTVTALTGTTVTVNAGVTPPTGGGFEIRRWDFAFMPGEDPGLVMRATLPNMTFARETANDKFYIRMFDGSTPPNYSEFSTALFINLPLGS